jgi:tRNA(Ile)-lysidine synthase
MPMQKNAEKTKSFELNLFDLAPGDLVLCAVSGGADSMCLLTLMMEAGREQGFSVAAAHYNHCLRGAESERDQHFVEHYCNVHGIYCAVGRGAVAETAAAQGKGVEETARTMRYAFLEETRQRIHARYIATAHTADDQAETVLFHLARGGGSRGLSGIPDRRGAIIRPMLAMRRLQVEQILAQRGVEHVEDSSNATAMYARNRIRHEVIPVLQQMNSGFVEHVCQTSRLLQEDDQFLTTLAKNFVNAHQRRQEGVLALPVQDLANLPRPIQSRVFRLLIGGKLEFKHVEMIRNLLAQEKSPCQVDLPGIAVFRERDWIRFGRIPVSTPPVLELQPGMDLLWAGGRYRICCRYIQDCIEIHNSFNTFFFKKANIYGTVLLRPRKEGDRLRQTGRECTKTVKKLFSEAAIPVEIRNMIPVLADDQGVLAVYGFGVDVRVAASPGDDVFEVQIIQLQGDESY